MPARFINVNNSGRAKFTNVNNSGRAVFGEGGAVPTTTAPPGNYLITIFARLTSFTGEDYQFQYQLNGAGPFIDVGGVVNGTSCSQVGQIAVSNSGTDDVLIRVVQSGTSTTYSFTIDLASTVCPAYDPENVSCNRQIINISANRDVAATIQGSTTC
jgi:hypothetical protein